MSREARLKAAAAQAVAARTTKGRRAAVSQDRLRRLRGLVMPGPAQIAYTNEWPEGQERGPGGAAAAANGKIYDPDGILDRGGIAHETFHLLDQQHLTDADRARLQGLLGKRVRSGVWDQGTGATEAGMLSPSEVAADWYAALVMKQDPKRGWSGGYSDGGIPNRKELLRFGRAVERLGKRYGLTPYTPPK